MLRIKKPPLQSYIDSAGAHATIAALDRFKFGCSVSAPIGVGDSLDVTRYTSVCLALRMKSLSDRQSSRVQVGVRGQNAGCLQLEWLSAGVRDRSARFLKD